MADPWTSAWEEAEATSPPGVTVYQTLELQHPAFIQDAVNVPIRVVNGVDEDKIFGIEAGAVFNGGGVGTFQAIPFFAERPEFAEGRTPSCSVTVDGVGRELTLYLEDAVQVKADLVVLFREYRSDDLAEPCYGPIQFVMRSVKVSGTQVIGTAQLDDLANRKFPFKTYTVDEFPGLLTT